MSNKWRILVKTGDDFGAGTDAKVFITLTSSQGEQLGPIKLANKGQNDFERSHVDEFIFFDKPLADISTLLIGHDGTGMGPRWQLVNVRVIDETNAKIWTFSNPRNYGWIPENASQKAGSVLLSPQSAPPTATVNVTTVQTTPKVMNSTSTAIKDSATDLTLTAPPVNAVAIKTATVETVPVAQVIVAKEETTRENGHCASLLWLLLLLLVVSLLVFVLFVFAVASCTERSSNTNPVPPKERMCRVVQSSPVADLTRSRIVVPVRMAIDAAYVQSQQQQAESKARAAAAASRLAATKQQDADAKRKRDEAAAAKKAKQEAEAARALAAAKAKKDEAARKEAEAKKQAEAAKRKKEAPSFKMPSFQMPRFKLPTIPMPLGSLVATALAGLALVGLLATEAGAAVMAAMSSLLSSLFATLTSLTHTSTAVAVASTPKRAPRIPLGGWGGNAPPSTNSKSLRSRTVNYDLSK